MILSDIAGKRLKKLLPKGFAGFSLTGFLGTCRGSTPCISPAKQPESGQQTLECNGITFFVNPELAERARTCSVDYDGSFLGKGLTASWPKCNVCNCHS